MTNEVSQWLAEIKTLQRQLAEVRQERDQAYASATNWRKLYESEAEQRRDSAAQAQTRIQALTQTLNSYQGEAADESELQDVIDRVNQIEEVAELRSQLIDALKLCDQLARRLKNEQYSHEQTRQSLTTALGDAIDLLAKEQSERKPVEPAVNKPVSEPLSES
ncbi:MAG: hypothetical protein AAFY78_02965 [Cyanobacteria bacterium J06648_16]